ncbi:MAG: Asp23/Gls24 family envelope stress response protein [Clostridiales bacterium]|nr:Asp23/Gls24 family envelope stress response protein [Clostridiales bacterium]
MKDSISQEDINRYRKMIVSLVNTAIAQTDGVAREYDVVKKKFGTSTMNTKNIHVYIYDNTVTIDIYINVLFGYPVPQVVCKLQENVLNLIKDSTTFYIKNINVNVSNVMFD